MDIKNQEWNSGYTKLTLKRVHDPKVPMEELQWGFPIATTLSLNKPHINQWKVKERDPPSTVGGLRGNNSE